MTDMVHVFRELAVSMPEWLDSLLARWGVWPVVTIGVLFSYGVFFLIMRWPKGRVLYRRSGTYLDLGRGKSEPRSQRETSRRSHAESGEFDSGVRVRADDSAEVLDRLKSLESRIIEFRSVQEKSFEAFREDKRKAETRIAELKKESDAFRAEAEEKEAQIRTAKGHVARLADEVDPLKKELERFRSQCVCLDGSDRAPLSNLALSLREFEDASERLRGIWNEFVADPAIAAALPFDLNGSVIDELMVHWVRGRREEIEALVEAGLSGAPQIAEAHRGLVVNSEALAQTLSERIFNRAIEERFDRTLRMIHRLYVFNEITHLEGPLEARYLKAVAGIREAEQQLFNILRRFDIEPVAIRLLEPVPDAQVGFVTFVQEIDVSQMYPRAARQPGKLVLDTKCWAYLDTRGGLRNSRKAHLVVSR